MEYMRDYFTRIVFEIVPVCRMRDNACEEIAVQLQEHVKGH